MPVARPREEGVLVRWALSPAFTNNYTPIWVCVNIEFYKLSGIWSGLGTATYLRVSGLCSGISEGSVWYLVWLVWVKHGHGLSLLSHLRSATHTRLTFLALALVHFIMLRKTL